MLFAIGCDSDTDKSEPADDAPKQRETSTNQTVPLRFTDRAIDSGINFTPRNGQSAGHFSILETLGSGAACFDYDVDGAPDVFVLGGGSYDKTPQPIGQPAQLFRNDAAWKFSPVAELAHAQDIDFYSHGAITGDFDSDGFMDVLVTGYHGLKLLQNCGDGTFVDATPSSGFAQDKWSTGAAWGDFNSDGHLDVFIVNYVNWLFDNPPRCDSGMDREVCTPGIFEAQRDALYLSDGAGGFVNATDQFGLAPDGKGLAAISADVDSDGDIDVYVANDTTPNFLYRNDGNRFTEIGLESGTSLNAAAEADGSMGIDIADFNGDGRCDICVANYERQFFALYRQGSEMGFDHVSSHVGITRVGQVYVGFGTAFLDADSDGDEDIFITNGHVMRHPQNSPVMQEPILFQNTNGKFQNRAADSGGYLKSSHMGRGLAVADFDLDGDSDAIVTHINQPIALLENTSNQQPHWLSVQLHGTDSLRDGLGARVEVHASGATQTRWTKSAGSFMSSSDPRLVFGLGQADKIDRLVIHWPSGKKVEYSNLPANHAIGAREDGSYFMLP